MKEEQGPSIVLEFDSISFEVGKKKTEARKKILDGITGRLESGQMVSVMGPSGAGKTTLMNILGLRANYGDLFGSLRLNGENLTGETFKNDCFFVEQHDKNWPYLTVRETCTFAARLFSVVKDPVAIEKLVNNVISEVGLNDVSDTRNSKLSGGQQRRLSLAVGLLKHPKVLFLDEVTSGLDSVSADQVCKILRETVYMEDILVICTIHQPSTKIFLNHFNQLVLLSKGRVAYLGGTADADAYFSNLGHPVPPFTNPSEHYLDLVNSDFGIVEDVDEILDAWSANGERSLSKASLVNNLHRRGLERSKVGMSVRNTLVNIGYTGVKAKHSLIEETGILFHRHFLMVCRDPVLYFGRCVMALILDSIFALVYWNSRDYVQHQVMPKCWLIVWYISVPVMMGTVAVYCVGEELKNIRNEQKNGMLRSSSYVVAKLILTIPFIFIFAISALGIPGWAIQNYPLSPWFTAVMLWSVTAYLYEAVAECLAVWVEDSIVAMLIYLGYWISSFLFSGLFLPLNDLHWPIKILYYLTPFSYMISSMYYVLFSAVDFEPCDLAKSQFQPICVESGEGSEVLEQLNKLFPLFENEDNVLQNIGVLASMAFFYKFLYIAGITYKSSKTSHFKKPQALNSEIHSHRIDESFEEEFSV